MERTFQKSSCYPLEIIGKHTEEIINDQLDIKLMEEELDAVLEKIKSREASGLSKIHPEIWKTRKFDNKFDYAM